MPVKHHINPGDRFGRLNVVDASDRMRVQCLCDCGNEKLVSASNLINAQIKSCGCIRAERVRSMGYANTKYKIAEGATYGDLTVVHALHQSAILCRCACGGETVVPAYRLVSGHTKSCGCLKRRGPVTHGLSKGRSPLYATWHGMMARCRNPKANGYSNYGGRGIRVHEPWHDAATFVREVIAEIGDRPEGKTLDRISPESNYEPGNIRWATPHEQARNKRNQWREKVTCPECGHGFPVGDSA